MYRIARLPILAFAAALPAAAQAGNVDVTLENVRAGGKLHVWLQTRETFLNAPPSDGKQFVPAAGPLSVTFENVAPGDYAVVVWHDDNDNGQFNSGPAGGPPLDGWTMTNADKLTGMPQFDQVKTAIGADGAKLMLPMRYGR